MVKGVRLARKSAYTMQDLVQMYIKSMKLASGLNRQCIFEAWDNASGAEKFTLKRFFRDGRLYITVSSSVIRNQLYFQREVILEKMNKMLEDNALFVRDGIVKPYIKELILK